MSYFALLTNLGAALIEDAYRAGKVIEISHMAIGDGGGIDVEPTADATSVAGEFDRVTLTSGASVSSMIGGGVDYESGLHAGKWIRNLGLIDTNGNLIVYGNCPPQLIVSQDETIFNAVSLNIQLPIINGDAVTVIVDRPPYPPATSSAPGMVRFATKDETLDGKVPDAAVAPRELAEALKLKSNTDHSHEIELTGDVSGSGTMGDKKLTLDVTVKDDSHSHSIDNIRGLRNELDGKSPSNHTHSLADLGAAAEIHNHLARHALHELMVSPTGFLGSIAMLENITNTAIYPGDTLAGSDLQYASTIHSILRNPVGTWRCLGTSLGFASNPRPFGAITMWIRIA